MGTDEHENLIRLIYKAAVDGTLWPAVMAGISDLVNGSGGILLYQHQASFAGTGMASRLDPAFVDMFYSHYALVNPFTRNNYARAMSSERPLRVSLDTDQMAKRDLRRTEFYNGLLKRFGIDSALMIGMGYRGMKYATINIARPLGRDGFDGAELALAESLHPHLVRSFELSKELEALRSSETTLWDAVSRSGDGYLMIDPAGSIVRASAAAEAQLTRGDGISVEQGRLCAASRTAGQKLQGLIARAASSQAGRVGGTMMVPRPSGARPYIVSVLPVEGSAAAPWCDGYFALVRISDPDGVPEPALETVRELFDLTAGEARVALQMLADRDAKKAAASLEMSIFTVRSHLHRIYAKTQTGSQAELLHLLMQTVGH